MPTWTKEQNEAIYKSGTNLIVSAGAGSGKTAVLTARVIHKLEQKIHMNELLILTFTKAAAGEMKERIRKSIQKKPKLSSELALLDTAFVTTFDAFALSIVKKYHYLLKIPSNISITDESFIEILRKDTLREIFDRLYEINNSDFLNLIGEFCVKDDNELYDDILAIVKKLEKDCQYKNKITNYKNNFMTTSKLKEWIIEYEKILAIKQKEIKERLNDLQQVAPKEYFIKCQEYLTNILRAENLDELYNVKSIKLPPLPKNMDQEVKDVKERLNEALKDLIGMLNYGNTEILQDDFAKTWPYINTILKIIEQYFEELNYQKQLHEYYDFNDIAKLALKLLKEFPMVCTEIKEQFKEIMIDEYQDTNNIQEEFISYISNHNVYMVGDIKQSIYRFRDANPYLFKSKYDQYRLLIDGEKIDLLKNFRSRQEVLQNINQIFNLIMNDELGGANYLEEHQMIFGNNQYMEKGHTKENYQMEILTYSEQKETGFTKEEIEIYTIGRDIQKKVQEGYLLFDKDKEEVHPAQYNDFVILMDRSTQFDLYKKIFNNLKIPICIYKDETLNQSTTFFVIKNALRILQSYYILDFNTNFKYAFTSVSRSFLFEYSDSQIYQCISNKEWYENSIFKTIKPVLENISTKSLPAIIMELYECLNVYEKIIKIGEIEENIMILNHLHTLAEECSKEGKTFNDFLEFLNRITEDEMQLKYATKEESTNSVKIMTIHKSKGLEYPICYFSGLYKSFNTADIKERFLYDSKYGFITPIKKEGLANSFIKELVKQNYMKEEISEKIRLFYVAMTRAKEKMIFILPKPGTTPTSHSDYNRLKNKSFADFLYEIWNNIKAYQQKIDLDSLNMTKDYLLISNAPNQSSDTISKIKVEEIKIIQGLRENKKYSKTMKELINQTDYENIEMGKKIHKYLECMDFKNPNYKHIPNSFLKAKIKKFIESPIIQENKHNLFFKEYEFIYEDESKELHGIIDLMILCPNKIILIDYKLSDILNNDYISQMKGYQKYIVQKSEKKVEIYLYSILNETIIPVDQELISV